MTKPYHHEDISVLAKSLRKQLAALEKPAGHLELLNMLARAAGQQNYQSWNALHTTGSAVHSAEPTERLELRLTWDRRGMEVFPEKGADGSVLDRRHDPVSRAYALIDVELRGIPHGGVIRTLTSLDVQLLEKHDPEDFFKSYVLPALGDIASRTPEAITLFGDVAVRIDRYVAENIRHTFNDMRRAERPITLPLSHRNRLMVECEQAHRSGKDFDRVKELLWDILGSLNPGQLAREQPIRLMKLAKYLEDYLGAEDDMFMGSWNREKLGGVADLLIGAARNPRSAKPDDWGWLRRSVFSAYAPSHWNRPIFAPRELFEVSANAA